MSGWDITANFINLVSRFPFERLLDRGLSDKVPDALEKRLLDKGLLKPSCEPLSDEHVTQAATDLTEALRMAK